MSGQLSTYSKPPISVNDQVDLLKTRWLIVPDEDKLKGYLENISYYHLSSYFKSFQRQQDTFDSGTTFDEVLNAYTFDKKLRLLMLDVTERIEKAFKCRLIQKVSQKSGNGFWHMDVASYQSQYVFSRYIQKSLNDTKTLNETDYKNYHSKYSSPQYPPAWIFF